MVQLSGLLHTEQQLRLIEAFQDEVQHHPFTHYILRFSSLLGTGPFFFAFILFKMFFPNPLYWLFRTSAAVTSRMPRKLAALLMGKLANPASPSSAYKDLQRRTFTNQIFESFTSIRVLAMSVLISGALKNLVASPRPYWVSDAILCTDPTKETSFGFPSGHLFCFVAVFFYEVYLYYNPDLGSGRAAQASHAVATGAAAAYGDCNLMSSGLRRKFLPTEPPVSEPSPLPAALFCVLLAALSLSRLYTGSHFVHDVLGGIVGGLLYAWVEVLIKSMDNSLGGAQHRAVVAAGVPLLALCFLAVLGCFVHVNDHGLVELKRVYEAVQGCGMSLGVFVVQVMSVRWDNPLLAVYQLPGWSRLLIGVSTGLFMIVIEDLVKFALFRDHIDVLSVGLIIGGYASLIMWIGWLSPLLAKTVLRLA